MSNLLARMCVRAGLRCHSQTPRRTPASFGLPYEEIRFRTAHRDGISLSGWLLPAANPRGLVILCHGYGSARSFMLPKARMLQRNGYTALLFDFRARGLSEGRYCTLGQDETEDVLGAIRFVRSREDLSSLPLALLGESMGGAAAILAAAREASVQAVITEGAFASLDQAVLQRFRTFLGPWGTQIAQACIEISGQEYGVNIASVAPVAAIAQLAPRPLFMIIDGLDPVCPRSESERLYAAASEPKQRWIVPGAFHSYAYQIAQKAYERRVTAFLQDAM